MCPAIDGPGEGLPLILGLQSMAENPGVLDMAQGKTMRTSPGFGAYDSKFARGATHAPLHDAMPKRSMIPCARFGQLETKASPGGLPAKKMTFHAIVRAEKEEPPSQSTGSSCSTGEPRADPFAAAATDAASQQQCDC